MNIKVIKDDSMPSHLTGGECGISGLEIYVDPRLPIRMQRILIIHSIIENYFRSIEHNKVDDIVELITEALDQLDGIEGGLDQLKEDSTA